MKITDDIFNQLKTNPQDITSLVENAISLINEYKSITELDRRNIIIGVVQRISKLFPNKYNNILIENVSHLYDIAIAAYHGELPINTIIEVSKSCIKFCC